jgi:hypothetical protein
LAVSFKCAEAYTVQSSRPAPFQRRRGDLRGSAPHNRFEPSVGKSPVGSTGAEQRRTRATFPRPPQAAAIAGPLYLRVGSSNSETTRRIWRRRALIVARDIRTCARRTRHPGYPAGGQEPHQPRRPIEPRIDMMQLHRTPALETRIICGGGNNFRSLLQQPLLLSVATSAALRPDAGTALFQC